MRHLKRILLALALAVSATAMIPAPAQADPGPGWVEICLPLAGMDEDGDFVIVEDCPTKIYLGRKIVIPCPPLCGPYFDIWDPKVDPEWQIDFFREWNVGIAALTESHAVEDPQLSERLFGEATEHLYNAAKLGYGVDAELNSAGWIDLESGEHAKSELLTDVGERLVESHRLMTKALEDHEGIATAMESYDEAISPLLAY
ncbi:hypothetical protein [Glycomyces arizonensis]|uniref:hypothetical protein n=1 Tax=Glycomyces arizonensis TaxID=256035 RepID=UPI0004156251|nr:hypothetical protein [Glycomyces arizonensis]